MFNIHTNFKNPFFFNDQFHTISTTLTQGTFHQRPRQTFSPLQSPPPPQPVQSDLNLLITTDAIRSIQWRERKRSREERDRGEKCWSTQPPVAFGISFITERSAATLSDLPFRNSFGDNERLGEEAIDDSSTNVEGEGKREKEEKEKGEERRQVGSSVPVNDLRFSSGSNFSVRASIESLVTALGVPTIFVPLLPGALFPPSNPPPPPLLSPLLFLSLHLTPRPQHLTPRCCLVPFSSLHGSLLPTRHGMSFDDVSAILRQRLNVLRKYWVNSLWDRTGYDCRWQKRERRWRLLCLDLLVGWDYRIFGRILCSYDSSREVFIFRSDL